MFSLLSDQKITGVTARERAAGEIALDLRAAFSPQPIHLISRLDALGRRLRAHRRTQGTNRPQDRRAVVIDPQLSHEGSINPDLVERKRAETAERREAGTEIVQ